VVPVYAARRGYWREARCVADALRAFAPDVVHTHGYRADLLHGAFGLVRRHAAVVTTMHGHAGGSPTIRFFQWIRLLALRRFDAVITVSDALTVMAVHHGVAPGGVFCAPYVSTQGLPLLSREAARELLALPPEGVVIGWVARLSREKGGDILLDAAASLQHREALLSIVGDGPERWVLRQQAGRLGLGPRCYWHGIIPFASRAFRAFDLLVMSSRSEGTPMVLLEALSSGVPVVAAAVGGIPAAISLGEALLVPPESPAALAKAIDAALANPEASRARAQNAKATIAARERSLDWMRRYEAAYAYARKRFRSR
jgi:glycosyltransferase involved in cell wall biosynthesis